MRDSFTHVFTLLCKILYKILTKKPKKLLLPFVHQHSFVNLSTVTVHFQNLDQVFEKMPKLMKIAVNKTFVRRVGGMAKTWTRGTGFTAAAFRTLMSIHTSLRKGCLHIYLQLGPMLAKHTCQNILQRCIVAEKNCLHSLVWAKVKKNPPNFLF